MNVGFFVGPIKLKNNVGSNIHNDNDTGKGSSDCKISIYTMTINIANKPFWCSCSNVCNMGFNKKNLNTEVQASIKHTRSNKIFLCNPIDLN